MINMFLHISFVYNQFHLFTVNYKRPFASKRCVRRVPKRTACGEILFPSYLTYENLCHRTFHTLSISHARTQLACCTLLNLF